MSNKTRLQTNNTNLQALIDKANALPDAGGGSGGGGDLETCTLTLSSMGVPTGDEIVYYIDDTLTLQQSSFPAFRQSKSVIVMKNSIIFVEYASEISGSIASIGTGTSHQGFFISGDATLSKG